MPTPILLGIYLMKLGLYFRILETCLNNLVTQKCIVCFIFGSS